MAFISTKCPNCGSNMELHDNQLFCPYCRTTLLQIADLKIDADVSVISASDFARKVEESKRTFIINVNNKLEAFDIDTKVINKRIDDATKMLQNGEYDKVLTHLASITEDILAVERLRYLAGHSAKNEYELSFYNGYVNDGNYEKLLSLCDKQSQYTYKRIEAFCRNNYDQRNAIKNELKQIDKLFEVELYDDAIAVSIEFCKKYPNSALSWAYLVASKIYRYNTLNDMLGCISDDTEELEVYYNHYNDTLDFFPEIKREIEILSLCHDSYITKDMPAIIFSYYKRLTDGTKYFIDYKCEYCMTTKEIDEVKLFDMFDSPEVVLGAIFMLPLFIIYAIVIGIKNLNIANKNRKIREKNTKIENEYKKKLDRYIQAIESIKFLLR